MTTFSVTEWKTSDRHREWAIRPLRMYAYMPECMLSFMYASPCMLDVYGCCFLLLGTVHHITVQYRMEWSISPCLSLFADGDRAMSTAGRYFTSTVLEAGRP